MQLAFQITSYLTEALQGSAAASVARGQCFLRLKGYLLFPDAWDVTVAASWKTVLSGLCPACCCAGGGSWQQEELLFSFGSVAGVVVCALVLRCICMG